MDMLSDSKMAVAKLRKNIAFIIKTDQADFYVQMPLPGCIRSQQTQRAISGIENRLF